MVNVENATKSRYEEGWVFESTMQDRGAGEQKVRRKQYAEATNNITASHRTVRER